MHYQPTSRRPRGFSLVELLSVIVIIGIVASLAITSIAGVNKTSAVTAARGQAQRIASIFAAGLATGAPGFMAANNVESAMNAVGTGSTGAGGMSTMFFQLGGISSDMDDSKPSEEQAKHYLSWESGTLVYAPAGGGDSGGGEQDDYGAWLNARAEAMSAYIHANPNTSEQEFQNYFNAWVTANPPPSNSSYNQLN